MSSGRMNNSSSSNTKPSWMTDRSNRNDTNNQRKRRRGKSMPARFLDNMPTLGFWKGNANNNNNNHANNRWNTKNDDREEKKIKTKNNHHLEASFPDLQKEMKRLSSSRGSRERGGNHLQIHLMVAITIILLLLLQDHRIMNGGKT